MSDAQRNERLNATLRSAQIDFEQRVVAMKKAHVAELERIKSSSDGAVQAARAESARQLVASTRELDELKAEMAKSVPEAEVSAAIAELQKQLADRAVIESDLRAQIASVQQSLESLQASSSDTNAQRDALQAQVSRLESQLA